jgi:hypothetical protein
MPDTCGHQCSLLRQGLCVGCFDEIYKNEITAANFFMAAVSYKTLFIFILNALRTGKVGVS